jgi:hypothetical protein
LVLAFANPFSGVVKGIEKPGNSSCFRNQKKKGTDLFKANGKKIDLSRIYLEFTVSEFLRESAVFSREGYQPGFGNWRHPSFAPDALFLLL